MSQQKPRVSSSERIPLKFKLGVSGLLLAVTAFAYFGLTESDPSSARLTAKAWVLIVLCPLVLLALWVPPVGRALLWLTTKR